MASSFVIVEAIYPGLTQLDFTGPHTVFSRLPGTQAIVASRDGGEVKSDGGLTFARHGRADGDRALRPAVRSRRRRGDRGRATISHSWPRLKRLAAGSRYLTSVCTGSLILGAAGLLKGKRAACHWAWRDMLPCSAPSPMPGRVVRDGDIITGGGVTAGIDFALVGRRRTRRRDVRPSRCSSASNTPPRRRSMPAVPRPRRPAVLARS